MTDFRLSAGQTALTLRAVDYFIDASKTQSGSSATLRLEGVPSKHKTVLDTLTGQQVTIESGVTDPGEWRLNTVAARGATIKVVFAK